MKSRILPLIIIFFLCSGCRTTASNASSPGTSVSPLSTVQLESASPEVNASSSQAPPETASPIALVLPSSKMFELTGVDAVLYNAAVQYEKENAQLTKADLNIPSLQVLDEYQNEDGSTCFILRFRSYFYYDIGYGLTDLKTPQYNLGSGGYDLSRFTVTKEGICTDVYVSADGEGWAYSIKAICGPKTALAAAIINNKEPQVTARDITSADPVIMLTTYLNYCFGQ